MVPAGPFYKLVATGLADILLDSRNIGDTDILDTRL
jgi:hypothetical protein